MLAIVWSKSARPIDSTYGADEPRSEEWSNAARPIDSTYGADEPRSDAGDVTSTVAILRLRQSVPM